ncbi:MAG: LCP family protein [Anaerolineales bacterium]|nr:LCP family protein [Anaerolineales bacterium]
MQRVWRVWGLGLMLAAAACSATPAPPLVSPAARTPVPTWTLPFDPAAGTPATRAPSETGAPPTPSPISIVAADTATAAVAPASDTPSAPPTPSATARPGIDPTLGATTPDPFATQDLPIPDPMPQLHLDAGVINILLIGRDTELASGSYRTDVMIVASINKPANAVTLLTIPRDLFVYIPGWTMNRINTAAVHGDATGYPGGGIALLEQTILYNLGIPIHGWAQVDFQGFKDLVDVVGGVDVPVSCAMQDWRLTEAALDPQNADNWALYTVETGVQHMDGDLALWYARSRKRSSDYDRSRRQHQVLRAIFDKALRLQMLPRVPELYAQYVSIVKTDLGLGDLLQFVPMAAQLDRARIKSRFIGRGHVTPWTTPGGAAVLLPNREAISAVLAEAFLPPPSNVLARAATAVEIWNGTNHADWTALAADNLTWSGLSPFPASSQTTGQALTQIYDFSTSAKNSKLADLKALFDVSDENVIAAPDPRAEYPYRVVLGEDFNSCVGTAGTVIVAVPTPSPDADTPRGELYVHAAAVGEPPPGMEGDLAEWAFLPYPIAEPIFGVNEWEGPADLAAVYNVAWDEEYLYLALDINDTTFVHEASGDQLYRGDGLELWFDAQLAADGGSHELNADDFQLGLSPGNLTSFVGGPEAYLWQPAARAQAGPSVIIAPRLGNGNYTLEAAVPWALFGVTPSAGQQFGFALTLNDDDTPGSAEQQTQVTNRKGQRLSDPTTWGVLVLDAPPAPAP